MPSRPLDLSVVIPAYNEEGAIGRVVADWDERLRDMGVAYELRVYDDGSKDATGTILEDLARERPRLEAVRQANRGHGPTVLRGYREALGDWVFQVDGDDELDPAAFPDFWRRREEADLVQGVRTGRDSPLGRRVLSAGARGAVRLLFGARIRDANVPYRLYRRESLRRLLDELPDEALAPNVLLSGLALRRGMRVLELPVPYRPRATGTPSLVRMRLWRFAAAALLQTLAVAWRARLAPAAPAQEPRS